METGQCPNGHVYGVGRAWALRSWMPCDCATAIDFDIGDGEHRHGHRTVQCRECLTTVYEPPCPKWEARVAENRRLAEEARRRPADQ